MHDGYKIRSYLVLIPFLTGLFYIHYFLQREDTITLCGFYTLVFAIYLFTLKYNQFSTKEILVLGVVSRLLLFWSLPNLSDDFYRFIWDGRLIANGINPFFHTPDFFMQNQVAFSALSPELYENLNSKSYFTIYPPISQFVFWISTLFTPNIIAGSVLVMRTIILSFEIGCMVLISKLLKSTNLNSSNALIYALNPLVILELTGNLHFEGIMLFFILGFIYFFQKEKTIISSVSLAFGIATKLVPLMFLPLLFKKSPPVKTISIYFLIGAVTILLFLPFLDFKFISGMSDSLDLFFRKFEFNGGLFFLFREIGFYFKGYDIIATLGPWMSLSAIVLILIYSFFIFKKNTYLPTAFIVISLIQLSLATTVHPWYIIPLVAFSSLTKFKFPIVWSLLIFYTYIGYSVRGYEHPFFIMALEYLVVIPLAIFEIMKFRNSTYLKT
ncbi:hypothetical protein [Reichenbachiella sp. MALMAid0571]|uniref:hypothetical protein n=1 Tax=Reichenbachiella sp. MALMAid0571 TaxID=3143939 RepID=UPI0032DEBD97